MATIFPSLDIINSFKVQPTPGERNLFTFLLNNLDDNYEIYFQPFLNGDKPDIILMRKDAGVMIIEVKDWHLNNFYIDKNLNWRLKENDAFIQPPIKQVQNYKENLFHLHIEKLYELNQQDTNIFGIIICAVYFHHETEQTVKNFHRVGINPQEHFKYLNYLNHFTFLGYDSLEKKRFSDIIKNGYLHRESKYFTEELYKSFKRYLQPPFHSLEDGKVINYTSKQLELSKSEVRGRMKIKGIAGGGKTLVLAKRAVNAHIRTQNRVLVLTFNISLKNYIHDRISDVRENFFWNYFEITNYHQFFIANANNYSLLIDSLPDFDNPRFFESVKHKIQKYDVILIDEIQDYLTEWLTLIHNYFLIEDGEFCVFGDEKQNIYIRNLDEYKEPRTVGIRGRFNTSLNKTFRFTPELTHLAENFQNTFFKNKYVTDQIDYSEQIALDFKSNIEYLFFKNLTDNNVILEKLFEILLRFMIHSSDVAILSSKIDTIRYLEYLVRTKKYEKTTKMFESSEEYEELRKKYPKNFEEEVDNVRRIRKFNFWMETGTMKFSTIHSFKGWEIPTLFLILENESGNNENWTVDELIYTAITRCRANLFIFNLGNIRYHNFFKNNISNCLEI